MGRGRGSRYGFGVDGGSIDRWINWVVGCWCAYTFGPFLRSDVDRDGDWGMPPVNLTQPNLTQHPPTHTRTHRRRRAAVQRRGPRRLASRAPTRAWMTTAPRRTRPPWSEPGVAPGTKGGGGFCVFFIIRERRRSWITRARAHTTHTYAREAGCLCEGGAGWDGTTRCDFDSM